MTTASRPGRGRRLLAWLRAFFFRPVPATSLGVMRIGLGLLLILHHLMLWPELELFFTDDGIIRLAALESGWSDERWSAYDLVSAGPSVHLLHGAFLLVLVAFTLGLGTPVAAVLSFLILIWIHHRAPWIQNGGDRVMRIMAMYLAVSPCGRALSLDRWLQTRRLRRAGLVEPARPLVPVFTHRLIQAQVMVIYAYTGIGKLAGSTWREGTALYYALSDENYARAPMVMDAIFATWVGRAAASLGTWLTSAWEVLFGLMVLWAPTRVVALIIGVGVHGGIWLTMSVGLFSFATLWGYLAFLSPAWFERAMLRRVRGARGPIGDGEPGHG